MRSTGGSSGTPRFRLRWFTPATEVKLCGHATLASAYTLFTTGLVNSDIIEFDTLSEILTAKKGDVSQIQNSKEHQNCFSVELDFPLVSCTEFDSTTEVSAISKALNGAAIIEIRGQLQMVPSYKISSSCLLNSNNFDLVVLPSAQSVIELEPRIDDIHKCGGDGIIATGAAPTGSGFDFASRCFYPKYGINEDPVNGGAHCTLHPIGAKSWKNVISSRIKYYLNPASASARGGILSLHLDEQNQRVHMWGNAVTVMEGTLLV
ncbi:hypothetical protein PTKIN_Ptkin12aG0121500 [Pterospermum kingtungense]